jgi:Flp pilus assembly protein TadD
VLPALLAAAVYAPTLHAVDFLRDDQYIVAQNALLRHWRSLPILLSTGYWEGALGAGAPVQEYRPALMASYFLNRAALGAGPWGFHLLNVLLHAAVTAALFAALRRRMAPAAAALAAALFAALPVHVEAVAYLAGRSELLSLLFLLLAWLDLEGPPSNWRRGLLWYALALLTKESAVAFPIFAAAADWVDGRPWTGARKCLHVGLWAVTAASLALRFVVLGRPFHGGYDYFTGVGGLPKLLTVCRFWGLHYALPLITGAGLSADYSRPLIADSGTGDPLAWACVLGWAVLAAATALALKRRRPAGLLGLAFFLPLLPTSHLIIKLDTIGADRFLYAPSIAVCALLAAALARAPRVPRVAAAAALLALYGSQTLARESVWLSEGAYARAAVRDNPVSAGARDTLGVSLAHEGRFDEAEFAFHRALVLNPRHPAAYFNLGRLYLDEGKLDQARDMLAQSTASDPTDADAWTLRAVVAERSGQGVDAARWYERALMLRPWDPTAHFNLGRLAMAAGRPEQAATHWRRYLELAPDAPDAAQIRRLLRSIGDDSAERHIPPSSAVEK